MFGHITESGTIVLACGSCQPLTTSSPYCTMLHGSLGLCYSLSPIDSDHLRLVWRDVFNKERI
jgi:hypothetical protein